MSLIFRFALFINACAINLLAIGQGDTDNVPLAPTNTYALIIGINYSGQSKIPTLKYASNDALLMKEFLRSKAGGEVPESNIILLINKQGTRKTLDSALTQLMRKPIKRGDRVIFYFAGHGLANEYNESFLLAYPTVDGNLAFNPDDFSYDMGAIEISKLKKRVAKLANIDSANVYLIIDACRNDESKTFFKYQGLFQSSLDANVGENQLLSCDKDQSSYENLRWEKHGAFTYFLIKGWQGWADENGDNKVTSEELEDYVVKNVKDSTKRCSTCDLLQKPKIHFRNSNEVLATVYPELKEKWGTIASLGELAYIPSVSRSSASTNEEYLIKFNEALNDNRFLYSDSAPAVRYLDSLFHKYGETEIYQHAKEDLVAALVNDALTGIQNYLQNLKINRSNNYNYYKRQADELSLALKYTDPKQQDYKRFLVRKLFLEGRALVNYDQKSYQQGIQKLDSALLVDSTLAYIYNALGIAYSGIKKYDLSIAYLKKAASFAPSWTAPLDNLGLISETLGNYNGSIAYFQQALQIDSGDYNEWCNQGLVYGDLKQYNRAITCFQKALQIYSDYALGWYNLACYNALLNKRETSLHFFEEALKRGYNDWKSISTDADLNNIRKLPQYEVILQKYKSK